MNPLARILVRLGFYAAYSVAGRRATHGFWQSCLGFLAVPFIAVVAFFWLVSSRGGCDPQKDLCPLSPAQVAEEKEYVKQKAIYKSLVGPDGRLLNTAPVAVDNGAHHARQRAAYRKWDDEEIRSSGFITGSAEEIRQAIEHTAIRVFREGGTVDDITAALAIVGVSASGCKQRASANEYKDCEFASKYGESISESFFRDRAQSMTITFPAERLDMLVKAVSSIYGQPRVTDNDNPGVKSLTGYDWGSSQEHLSVHAGTQMDDVHSWMSFVRYPPTAQPTN